MNRTGRKNMPGKFRGVMQSPVPPLKDDFSLDLPTFERLLNFHVRTGATAISWPHHKGESLNLTIPERKLFAEAAVRVVDRGDPRLFRAALQLDRAAGAVVQLAELSRRRRDDRRSDVAAHRAIAQF